MKKMIKFNFNQIVDCIIVFSLLDVNINKIPPSVVSWEIHYENIIKNDKWKGINGKNKQKKRVLKNYRYIWFQCVGGPVILMCSLMCNWIHISSIGHPHSFFLLQDGLSRFLKKNKEFSWVLHLQKVNMSKFECLWQLQLHLSDDNFILCPFT